MKAYVPVSVETPPERDGEYYVKIDDYKGVCVFVDEAFWSDDRKQDVKSWLRPVSSLSELLRYSPELKKEVEIIIAKCWANGLKNGQDNIRKGYSNENTLDQTINSILNP